MSAGMLTHFLFPIFSVRAGSFRSKVLLSESNLYRNYTHESTCVSPILGTLESTTPVANVFNL
jgi:hypothetical protein